jgi:hypothetical protein
MRMPGRTRLLLGLALVGAVVLTATASANVALTQIAVDPFTNTTSQHRTVVEPDSFSFGSTIVTAAQEGRFFDGGASGIGFGTSTDNGATWRSGVLPQLTVLQNPAGAFDRVTDPSVAFDARHNVWMVSSLGLRDPGPVGKSVLLSRSTDGGLTWAGPRKIATAVDPADFDKNWTVCDNTSSSPFFGSCYTQWDDFGNGNRLKIAFSRDGGLTWTLSTTPNVGVIGGQPLVQPNGNVVVPIDNAFETALGFTISTNGGVSFGQAFTITSITAANDPGNIRSGPLPSAEIDGAGKIFVVWEDCRFRAGCTTNDLVFTSSSDGTNWAAVQRIPIDPVTSTVDHFIPGVAVDPATSGNTAHVAVAFYFYPDVNCTEATCQLDVGFISSTNGGATWGAMTQLTGPMVLGHLPDTSRGRMVGDYISTSFAGGTAHPVFPVAFKPCGSPSCDQRLFTTASGLAVAGGAAVARDPVVFSAKPAPGRSAFKRGH